MVVADVEGGLPQPPVSYLNIIDLIGAPKNWKVRPVQLTGLVDDGCDDSEPEFVNINENNITAVTLQVNNHIVFVNLANGEILRDFNGGTVTLRDIDTGENKLIDFTSTLIDVAHESDGIAWLDNNKIVIANEGDLSDGSRGFSVFIVTISYCMIPTQNLNIWLQQSVIIRENARITKAPSRME